MTMLWCQLWIYKHFLFFFCFPRNQKSIMPLVSHETKQFREYLVFNIKPGCGRPFLMMTYREHFSVSFSGFKLDQFCKFLLCKQFICVLVFFTQSVLMPFSTFSFPVAWLFHSLLMNVPEGRIRAIKCMYNIPVTEMGYSFLLQAY